MYKHVNAVRVAGCFERAFCFNPLVAATAFDNNASVVVTFTNPPSSFSYKDYSVCLRQYSYVRNVVDVTLKVSVMESVHCIHNVVYR